MPQEIFIKHLLLLLFFWLGHIADIYDQEDPVSSAELPGLAESASTSNAPARSAYEIHLYAQKSWRGGVEVIASIEGMRLDPNALDEWIEYLPQHYHRDPQEVAIYAQADLEMEDLYCLTRELRRHGFLRIRYMHSGTAGMTFR